MKILVVEDTEDSRVLLVDQLEVQGYEVESAINGVEALEKIRITPPDIIISDILMPKMDGFELCQTLKKNPQLKKIPVIFYTATYTEPSDQKLALSMGATRFIIKPADPVVLFNTVAEVVAECERRGAREPCEQLMENGDFKRQHTETISKKLFKKMEELEEQKEQLQIITDAIPEMISEIDEFGCYKYVNEAYEKWYLLARNEIVGRKMEDIVEEECFNSMQPYVERAQKGEEVTYEEQMLDGNANKRYVQTRYIPRRNKDGTNNGFFSFTYDLTEQKLAEKEKEKLLTRLQQAEKMEAIGQLAGGIAHDFNNILAAIMGYAELAKLDLFETSKASKDIDQVIIAGKRATKLVKQILTFSRKTDQQKTPIRIDSIVKEALQLIRSSLPATIDIQTSIDGGGGLVCADPTSIHQVVINLCTNASQAIGNKKGKLEVILRCVLLEPGQVADKVEVQAGSFLMLTVKDTGNGMDKKTVARIFEPYFTTKKKEDGTGLGLAVIHGIVEDCNGFIEVESTSGKGSIFRVFLPTVTKEEIEVTDKKDTIQLPTGNERILYVDDEPMLTDIGQSTLTMLGYTVNTETKSPEALIQFQENPDSFDLVITDQTMPDLTGVELAQAMLRLKPGLPIILCTGQISALSEKEVYALGIKKIITKPLSQKILAETVRGVLDDAGVSTV